MAERIRLSQKARAKLLTLAAQTDTDPSYFLEHLINRYGAQAVRELLGSEPIAHNPAQQIPIRPVSDTNAHKTPQTDTNGSVSAANSPIDAFLEMEI